LSLTRNEQVRSSNLLVGSSLRNERSEERRLSRRSRASPGRVCEGGPLRCARVVYGLACHHRLWTPAHHFCHHVTPIFCDCDNAVMSGTSRNDPLLVETDLNSAGHSLPLVGRAASSCQKLQFSYRHSLVSPPVTLIMCTTRHGEPCLADLSGSADDERFASI
jgi:hypothetical protein